MKQMTPYMQLLLSFLHSPIASYRNTEVVDFPSVKNMFSRYSFLRFMSEENCFRLRVRLLRGTM